MNSLKKHTINKLFGMCAIKTEQVKILPCKTEDIYKIISDENFLYMDTDGTFITKKELLK